MVRSQDETIVRNQKTGPEGLNISQRRIPRYIGPALDLASSPQVNEAWSDALLAEVLGAEVLVLHVLRVRFAVVHSGRKVYSRDRQNHRRQGLHEPAPRVVSRVSLELGYISVSLLW